MYSVAVCISMLTKFMNFVPKHKQGDKSELEKHLHNYCKEVEFKEPKEHRLVNNVYCMNDFLLPVLHVYSQLIPVIMLHFIIVC